MRPILFEKLQENSKFYTINEKNNLKKEWIKESEVLARCPSNSLKYTLMDSFFDCVVLINEVEQEKDKELLFKFNLLKNIIEEIKELFVESFSHRYSEQLFVLSYNKLIYYYGIDTLSYDNEKMIQNFMNYFILNNKIQERINKEEDDKIADEVFFKELENYGKKLLNEF